MEGYVYDIGTVITPGILFIVIVSCMIAAFFQTVLSDKTGLQKARRSAARRKQHSTVGLRGGVIKRRGCINLRSTTAHRKSY